MISVPVTEVSQVAEARRACVGLAERNGFDEEAAGRVALIATELGTNLVKHGGGGHIISAAFDDVSGATGVEVIAIDKGPGIPDIAHSLQDGVSAAGTAGNGLGAIKRQSESFEIFSHAGQGTVVITQVLPGRSLGGRKPVKSAEHFPVCSAVSVPMPGETANGDAWAVRSDDESRTLMVVDGLGHGPEAAKVAAEATRLFDKYWRGGPAEVVRSLHAGLRPTRGGAVGVARIEHRSQQVTYAGVGNIAAVLISDDGTTRRMISHNGTVGHNARVIQQLGYPFAAGLNAVLVMHSDGLSTNWSLSSYPGLIARHPLLIASVLYRDHSRGRDDATVLVSRVA